MRVVYFNPAAQLGGAERSLLDVMASVLLEAPSTELHLIVPEEGPLIDRARDLGVGITVLKMPMPMMRLGDSRFRGRGRLRALAGLVPQAVAASVSGAAYVRCLRRAVQRLKPDVIHSNGIKSHVLSSFVGTGGPKVIWHIRDFLGTRPMVGRILRRLAHRARRAVAISDAVAHDARRVLPDLPIDVVHNAIRTDVFTPGEGDGATLDRLAGLPPAGANVVRVGLVATYALWKGHGLFLEAAARLTHRRDVSLRFYVIGGPIYETRGSQTTEDALREKARALGIADCVGLVAFQEKPADAYRCLDIVVHASTQPEPFGRTIVEAMACGKPVVVSRAGGAAELFGHMDDALGVPPSDPAALADAIERLARDPDMRIRLGASARHSAVERFSHTRLGPQFLEIYGAESATIAIETSGRPRRAA
ncbi:MAG: glycosyltransferase family 4 protein [Planctomycetes bacterium]|nr:glycosyltransferase family 4 protein [Planctomycetota bacterium]